MYQEFQIILRITKIKKSLIILLLLTQIYAFSQKTGELIVRFSKKIPNSPIFTFENFGYLGDYILTAEDRTKFIYCQDKVIISHISKRKISINYLETGNYPKDYYLQIGNKIAFFPQFTIKRTKINKIKVAIEFDEYLKPEDSPCKCCF